MLLKNLSLALCTISAVYALPATLRSAYAVKERHIVPRGWTEAGPASKSEGIHLQIGLKQRNEGMIEQHLLKISDPSHARYGQHLSAAEIHDIVSPSSDSVELVHAWLLEHNITNAVLSPAKDWFSVVVPIGKAEQLLQTSYKVFSHEDGSTISRAPEWSLPSCLHEHIDVVQPTTSFFRGGGGPKQSRPREEDVSYSSEWLEIVDKAKRDSVTEASCSTMRIGTLTEISGQSDAEKDPIFDVCAVHLTTPRCLRTLYGTLHYKPQAAKKNSIAITNYLNETNKRDDIHLFLKTFRPAIADVAYEFPIEIIADAPNDQSPVTKKQKNNFEQLEGNMDVELVLAISYPTPLKAYSTGGSPPYNKDLLTPTDTNEPYLTWLNYVLAKKDLPYVISTSYADDEQTVPESYARRVCAGFAQLGARGITLLFGSGDHGVGPDRYCQSNTGSKERTFLPTFPPSCPWVTSVGATKGFSPEVATTYFASGGGFSNYFKMPNYQQKTVDAYVASLDGLHEGKYNPSGRAYPDVSAQGNRDAVGWADHITWDGGTSAASPTFAAVLALVNDALLAKGHPPLGFINPWLYGGAYNALTDVKGGSSFGCGGVGFPAQEGWDAVTGFGTPNFRKLVEAAFEQYGGWDGQGLT